MASVGNGLIGSAIVVGTTFASQLAIGMSQSTRGRIDDYAVPIALDVGGFVALCADNKYLNIAGASALSNGIVQHIDVKGAGRNMISGRSLRSYAAERKRFIGG